MGLTPWFGGFSRDGLWLTMNGRAALVSVGNTRTRVARFDGEALQPSRVHLNADLAALVQAVEDAAPSPTAPALIASVNDPVADPLADAMRARGRRVVVCGRGAPIPMATDLAPGATAGVDRLLAGLGAYSRSGEACVVIDAGTAVTVDFIDARGVFRGGCIAPGLSMMLRSLHQGTAALPLIELRQGEELAVGDGPLGRATAEAMTLGCVAAVQGMARLLIDRYAELNGSYPRIVATGGDAPRVFANDDLVEQIVPDLVLMGMAAMLGGIGGGGRDGTVGGVAGSALAAGALAESLDGDGDPGEVASGDETDDDGSDL
jgi:type III pantothenate kinase